MKNLIIRKAKLDDALNLIKLIIPEFVNRSDESILKGKYYTKWSANFKEMISSSMTNIFLAEKSNELVGITTVYLLPRLELAGYHAVLEDVYVKESERSKGIGSILIKEVITFITEKEVKYV